MDKHRIAEKFLSSVMPTDRAASAVGDFSEVADDSWSFWISITRTFASHVWHDLAENPAAMIGLSLRSLVYSNVLTLLVPLVFLGMALILIAPIVIGISAMFPSPAHPASPSPHHYDSVITTLSYSAGLAWTLFAGFQTGRWIARRAPGREIAACIAGCFVQWLIFALVGFGVMLEWGAQIERYLQTHSTNASSSALLDLPLCFLCTTSILAGALQVRSRMTRTAAN
jgi:hypothetical protein